MVFALSALAIGLVGGFVIGAFFGINLMSEKVGEAISDGRLTRTHGQR